MTTIIITSKVIKTNDVVLEETCIEIGKKNLTSQSTMHAKKDQD